MTRQNVLMILWLATFFSAMGMAEASVLYVDADSQAEVADGLDWTTAFTDLQDALSEANTGEIWVAAGVYHPAPSGGEP